MSWSFAGSGENANQAVGDFLRQLNDNAHIPAKMKASIALTTGTLVGNFPVESVKTIRAHGHTNDDGSGNVTVSINS